LSSIYGVKSTFIFQMSSVVIDERTMSKSIIRSFSSSTGRSKHSRVHEAKSFHCVVRIFDGDSWC